MRKSDPSDVSDASDIFSISFPYARAQEQELENVSDASEVSGTIVLMAQNERCSVLHCANKQLIRGTTMPIFLQVFLPYALMNMRDCRFLPMNREYKPLRGLTTAKAARIGLKDGGNFYYLYDDATQPQSSSENWRRYEQILEKLMKLEVEPVDVGRSKPAARRYENRVGV
jgi:hypothetical protein